MKHLVVWILGAIVSATPIGAEEYHVAPTGSDVASGTAESPWASLRHAAATAVAGDTVIVHGGTYTIDQRVVFAHSGAPGQWITFRAAEGETPVFDADALRPQTRGDTGKGALHLHKVHHIRIVGLTLRNSYGFGIGVFNGSSHIDLVDNTISTTFAPAIGCWNSAMIRVVGNDVSNSNTQDLHIIGPRQREAPHEAISIAGIDGFEVAWNHVHHNVKEGIDVKEISRHGVVHHNYLHDNRRQAMYADAWFGLLTDVRFHSNVAHDNEWGVVISVEGRESRLTDVRVDHNLLYKNRASGVYFGTWGGDGPRSDIVVEHNTIWHNGRPNHWAGATGSIDLRSANYRDVIVQNNLCVAGPGAFEIATILPPDAIADTVRERNIVIRSNLIATRRNDNGADGLYARPHAYPGEPVIVGEPRLGDPEAGDFTLQPDSPAIGAGHGGADIGALPRGAVRLPDAGPSPLAGEGFLPYTPHRLAGWPAALLPVTGE